MNESDRPPPASFLKRWARRKDEAAARDGLAAPAESLLTALPISSTGAAAGEKMPETPHPEPTLPIGAEVKKELPSIDNLTHEADFSPFMAKDVAPGLRNQAMKKLFTDPHYQFGQMDKLDIYIDDYSQPDPIPLEMLRKMHQSKSLFLFDDEKEESPHEAAALTDQTYGAPLSASDPVNSADATVAAPERTAGEGKGSEKALPQKMTLNNVGEIAVLPNAGKSA